MHDKTTSLQSGSFIIDGDYVLFIDECVGSLTESIHCGLQIMVVKTNGTLFPNDDARKYLNWNVPSGNALGISADLSYPQASKEGIRLLAGQKHHRLWTSRHGQRLMYYHLERTCFRCTGLFL